MEWVFSVAEWGSYKTTTDCGSCTPLCGRAGASEWWWWRRMRSGNGGEHTWPTERVSDVGKTQSLQVVRSSWTVERKEMLGGRCCGLGMRWRRKTCLKKKMKKCGLSWRQLHAQIPLCTYVRCALSNASQLLGSIFLQIFVSSYVIPSRSWNMKFKACV